MSDLTQIERILKIIQILSNGSYITTSLLLDRFDGDVSRRTLQRDFQRIQSAGIPLRSRKTQANENQWYLESQYRSFIPQPLGLNEYLAAYVLRENLKVFHNTSFSAEVDSLLEKIEQIVPENVFIQTEEIDPRQLYENYTAGNYDYTGHDDHINDLIRAILERKRCYVTYYNPDEDQEKGFYLEPHRLVYYSGGLYVIGYMRHYENFLLLAIQRIRLLKVRDETFPEEPIFDPAAFWQGKFGLFNADPVTVRLRFKHTIKHHIENRIWHPSQNMSLDPHGDLILEMQVGLTPELISWILSWSDYVKVLAPVDLITTIRERIEAMQSIYKGKTP